LYQVYKSNLEMLSPVEAVELLEALLRLGQEIDNTQRPIYNLE